MLSDARLRFAGLLAAGSLAVHQLRYAAGYGGDSERALADQGHAYLGAVGALSALLLAVALGAFLGAILRARPARDTQSRFASLWLAAGAGLSVIYAAQELIEGALVTGHPAGAAAVFGHGGSWAFAAAAVIGGLIALAMRGAAAALEIAAARRPVARAGLRRRLALVAAHPAVAVRPGATETRLARGPPLLLR